MLSSVIATGAVFVFDFGDCEMSHDNDSSRRRDFLRRGASLAAGAR
jgi:hypothetical protein